MAEITTHSGISSANTLFARMGGKLGVSRLRSDRDVASLVERQLPASSIRALVRGGLSDAEVYQLIVPRRTLAHRIANRQPLSRDESDKAVRVARVAAAAEQVFGDPERAWRWLRKPKRQFGNRKPVEMLSTEAGARIIEEMVANMDDGTVA